MILADFDYTLPEQLIANKPLDSRHNSKLMVLDKSSKKIHHRNFYDIVEFLGEDDVLVLNNTRVLPARLFGHKLTGGAVEVFLLKQESDDTWQALLNPSKRIKANTSIKIAEGFWLSALELLGDGKWRIKFDCENANENIAKCGHVPLPPYIEKGLSKQELENIDKERYQTVYSEHDKAQSVAAPTAGLHFTDEILGKLQENGVKVCYVTLNVGLGTFKPVKCDDITSHKMDTESFEIPEDTANIINQAQAEGKNIVAVGTTTVRTLETVFNRHGEIKACKGESDIFIYPGYRFKIVDKLITNFHLPKSTLIMLVSAFAGHEFVFEAYQAAIDEGYRFYSFGDCMLVS